MKNLKKFFSLLCLSAAITSGKVNARIIPKIAGCVTSLVGAATCIFGYRCLVDTPQEIEDTKNAATVSKIFMGVGVATTTCGLAEIIDDIVNN